MSDNRDLVYEVIRIAAEFDEGDTDCFMFWPITDQGIRVSVNCSDVFHWGSADADEVTSENLPLLRKAYEDYKAASPDDIPDHAGLLFCARLRNMRPHGAFYKGFAPWEAELFDAAGPEREINFFNPQSPAGEYKWPECDQYKEIQAKRAMGAGE